MRNFSQRNRTVLPVGEKNMDKFVIELGQSLWCQNHLFLRFFVVKSAQAVTLSIIVLMCVTINDRTALKVTDVGLKLHHPKWGGEVR